MVKMAEPETSRPTYQAGTTIESTGFRRFSSIPLIILLYTAATPFTPAAWVTYELEGSFLIDRLLAGILLFSAIFFQWQLAAQTHPVAICLPTGNRQTIRNGVVQSVQGGGELLFIYKPASYWVYVGAEALLLLVAEFGSHEIWRRCIVSSVIGALWSVGWFVTPDHIKKAGWDYAKQLWFWIALDEVMRVGRGGPNGARRRH